MTQTSSSLHPPSCVLTRRRLQLTNEVISIKADEPFNIIIANYNREQVELPNWITFGYGIPRHPAEIYRSEPSTEAFTRHVTQNADRPQEEKAKNSPGQIDLNRSAASEQELIFTSLYKQKSMWSAERGQVRAPLHQIGLIPEARPARSHLYRKCLRKGDVEDLEVN